MPSKLHVLNRRWNGYFALCQLGAIAVQTLEIVRVVDHPTKRLFDAFGREVAQLA